MVSRGPPESPETQKLVAAVVVRVQNPRDPLDPRPALESVVVREPQGREDVVDGTKTRRKGTREDQNLL